jgi:hypothetical protein
MMNLDSFPNQNKFGLQIFWAIWFVFMAGFTLAGCNVVMVEVPTPAPSQDGAIVGTIVLDPFVGAVNSLVTLTGQDWPAETDIVVTMTIGEAEYTVANTTTDADGKFTTSFVIPENPDLKAPQTVPIAVTIKGSNGVAQTYLVVSGRSTEEEAALTQLDEEPTVTPTQPISSPLLIETATVTPAPTPLLELTATKAPRPTPRFIPIPLQFPTRTPTPTPDFVAPTPEGARAIVVVSILNVRSGPGLAYPVIGQIRANQEYEILGRYGRWWLISFLSQADDQGWISGDYVEAENVQDIPIIIPPPTPVPTATSTATPTPTVVKVCNPGEWSGCGGRPPAITCFPDYVSQCTAEGQWGQCVWDPGFCWGTGDSNDDDDDDADDEDDTGGDDDDTDNDDDVDDDDVGDDDDDENDDDQPDDDDTDDDDDDT